MSSDTFNDFHEYEIRWTPEQIDWVVDGVVTRTKKKSETWNATANQWNFPQTPSRVQISLWPGGLETNAKGTIDWAGGVIDWNGGDIKDYGYYFATFSEISVKCYNAQSPPGTNKKTSYYYNHISATNNTVVDSDRKTVLKSFGATGTNMDYDDGTATGGSPSASVHSIPGGGSPGGQVPGGGSGGSGTGSAAGCVTTGFAQSCQGQGGSGSGSPRGVERTLGASAFAVIVGIVGLLFL